MPALRAAQGSHRNCEGGEPPCSGWLVVAGARGEMGRCRPKLPTRQQVAARVSWLVVAGARGKAPGSRREAVSIDWLASLSAEAPHHLAPHHRPCSNGASELTSSRATCNSTREGLLHARIYGLSIRSTGKAQGKRKAIEARKKKPVPNGYACNNPSLCCCILHGPLAGFRLLVRSARIPVLTGIEERAAACFTTVFLIPIKRLLPRSFNSKVTVVVKPTLAILPLA